MLDFRVSNIVPPGGRYFFLVPETGVRLEAFTETGLHTQVLAHYRENKRVPPENLKAVMRDHMCQHLPQGFCYSSDGSKYKTSVVRLQEVKDKTSKLAAGNPRVPPGVARRRAVICSRCPLNNKSMCTTCVGMTQWARRLAGRSLGGADEALGICEVDRAALAAKVHMSNIADNADYPDNCWKHNQ